MDQRRVLLAFLLMAAVLAGSQWWYSTQAPPPVPAGSSDTTAVAAAPSSGPPPSAPPDSLAAVDSTPAAAGPSDANVLLGGRPAPAAVLVETPLYRALIDPVGGGLRQIELLNYRSFTDSGPVALVPRGGAFLNRTAELGQGRVAFEELTFAPGVPSIRLAEGDSAATLVLRHQAGGREIVQSYRFTSADYLIDYTLALDASQSGVLVTGLGPRLESNEKKPREDYAQLRAVVRLDGEVLTHQAKDVDEGAAVSLAGDVGWAGLRNKYFLAMILPPVGGPALSGVTIGGEPNDSLPRLEVAVGAPIQQGRGGYRLYFGPQEYRRLQSVNAGLDGVNQYGWSWIRWMITPFAKGIVLVMLWLHQWIPSYGLVLIVFAVLIRLILWPLTTKSFRSIQAMQQLQPEIQRLREQHKRDPQKMQQETMRLYRERKVNPLGGCLPNLIPLPVLFALFFVFQGTIELRNQPFLWLPDLSQPDPIYILPVLMGLTMLISSKMTATDPKMAAMTYIMPIVLTFVFLNLASGLVLYYAVSNVLTFAQQWWLKRGTTLPPAEPAGPQLVTSGKPARPGKSGKPNKKA
ncbi:MAG: membrane protein insertase YidC [Gemmatimonadota bacterium]